MTDDDFSRTRAQVHAAQSGDEEALNELFARYLPRVTRLVAARLGEQWIELANEEDLVQESFVDALKALRGGKVATDGWSSTSIPVAICLDLVKMACEFQGPRPALPGLVLLLQMPCSQGG